MKQEPRISRLGNGAVIASVENYSPVSHVSIIYNAGSRYEDANTEGIGYCLRNLADTANKKSSGNSFRCSTV